MCSLDGSVVQVSSQRLGTEHRLTSLAIAQDPSAPSAHLHAPQVLVHPSRPPSEDVLILMFICVFHICIVLSPGHTVAVVCCGGFQPVYTLVCCQRLSAEDAHTAPLAGTHTPSVRAQLLTPQRRTHTTLTHRSCSERRSFVFVLFFLFFV